MKVTDLYNGMLFYYKPYKYDSGLKKGKIIRLDQSGRGARHKVVMFNVDGTQTSEFDCTSRAIYRPWTQDDETKWQELAQEQQFQAVRAKLEADEKAREQAAKQAVFDKIVGQLTVLGFQAVVQQLQSRLFDPTSRTYGYTDAVCIVYTEELATFLEPLVNEKLLGTIFAARKEVSV